MMDLSCYFSDYDAEKDHLKMSIKENLEQKFTKKQHLMKFVKVVHLKILIDLQFNWHGYNRNLSCLDLYCT